MIEEMVVLLKAEQGDDDSKKARCFENFNKTEDAKALAKTIVGHKGATQEFQEQLSNTDDRMAIVQKSIAELDDSVAKATEMRRNQHAEFMTLTANNVAATKCLKLAVNRLNKFYALKLHKAAPKAEQFSRQHVRQHGWRDHHRCTHGHRRHECRTGAVVAGRSRVLAFLLQAREKSRGVQRRLVTHRVSGGGSGQSVAGGRG